MNLTPQQRLATSRRAIVQSMHRDHQEHRSDDMPDSPTTHTDDGDETLEGESNSTRSARPRSSGLNGLWRTVRRTASTWWQSHPAHLAVDVVHPMIEKYAQANPLKLLGVAAAVGAVVVIAKPWRLISVTGLVVAAFRSTQMSSLIASVLSSPPARPQDR
jgi:ElaB/YqjD/DUF883 family membrane-anchored ribosome-binding protein